MCACLHTVDLADKPAVEVARLLDHRLNGRARVGIVYNWNFLEFSGIFRNFPGFFFLCVCVGSRQCHAPDRAIAAETREGISS